MSHSEHKSFVWGVGTGFKALIFIGSQKIIVPFENKNKKRKNQKKKK